MQGGYNCADGSDLTLRTGDFKKARAIFDGRAEDDFQAEEKTVGFKWRMWGPPEEVAQLCIRQQAAVFHLYRADLLDLAASLYFTSTVLPEAEKQQAIDLQGGGHHLQFKLSKMSKEAREALKAQMASIRFSIDLDQFISYMRTLSEDKSKIQKKYIEGMQKVGVPVYALRYEDFVNDQSKFFKSVCRILDVDYEKIDGKESYYQRVGSGKLSEQIDNWDEITASPEVKAICAAYSDAINSLQQIG